MALYLDTSCLLKLFFMEPETKRTLDRLHLATMEALGLRRLLTNDDMQASAARALGYDVLLPR